MYRWLRRIGIDPVECYLTVEAGIPIRKDLSHAIRSRSENPVGHRYRRPSVKALSGHRFYIGELTSALETGSYPCLTIQDLGQVRDTK